MHDWGHLRPYHWPCAGSASISPHVSLLGGVKKAETASSMRSPGSGSFCHQQQTLRDSQELEKLPCLQLPCALLSDWPTACLSSQQLTLNDRSAESEKLKCHLYTSTTNKATQTSPCSPASKSLVLSSAWRTIWRECRAGDPWEEMRSTDALRQDMPCLLRPQHQPK